MILYDSVQGFMLTFKFYSSCIIYIRIMFCVCPRCWWNLLDDHLNEKLVCLAGCFLSQLVRDIYLLQGISFLLSALEAICTHFLSIKNCFSGVTALRVQLAVSIPAEWHLHPASRGNANNHAASGTKISIFMLKNFWLKASYTEDDANLSCFCLGKSRDKSPGSKLTLLLLIELSVVLKF